MESENLLQLEGVFYRYEGAAAPLFEGIHFSLAYGRKIAVIGPSGVGKTTLLGLIGLLVRLQEGRLFLGGADLTTASEDVRALYRRGFLSFVYQTPYLLKDFTALENIALRAVMQGIAEKEAHRRARDLLGSVGLGPQQDFVAAELSGGQQQRVALARALVTAPRLILADEPMGSLDFATAAVVSDILFSFCESQRAGLLCVTHNQKFAARFDEVWQLEDRTLRPVDKESL